ncbi:MAG: aminopeptidase N [Casimicrobiaceae bacterium]|nr:aminopeptidase N [Casimicrobiaceae bacterium]
MQRSVKLRYRSDYEPPCFFVPRIELDFELELNRTQVTARLHFERSPSAPADAPLELNGEGHLETAFELNGQPLPVALPEAGEPLLLHGLPARGVLGIQTVVDPSANTALLGLYAIGEVLCTQCEAEGFRRITWFPDRPDVLSRYRVRLCADRERFPVLLSNGNLISAKALPGGRHECLWEDPYPKPCYLFALVAGRLECLQDEFVTSSGRPVRLELYSDGGDLERLRWALSCLKSAMRWDEQHYGREYDLDRFMIFAASEFNAGAMENKGLNIFNRRYLLADPEIATDEDYQAIDAVVAHEYFHNWSGNRVTCRDWFQLSLKEGLTVYREQQYMAGRTSAAVARIDQAAILIHRQFPQAAGPMAHPVRPERYEAIENFYTVTVYEKGAEVLRMLHRLVGDEAWRRGCDLYFSRHDGQAVTCDDFLAAIAEASGRDLRAFARWYSQAGTPRLSVTEAHDPTTGRFSLLIVQQVPATQAQTDTQPMVIPLSLALLDRTHGLRETHELVLEQEQTRLVFEGWRERPVVSLLRGFSAPVEIEEEFDASTCERLALDEEDSFARWAAVRRLYAAAFSSELHAQPGRPVFEGARAALRRVLERLLAEEHEDPALLARLLALPSVAELVDRLDRYDPQRAAAARHRLVRALCADTATLAEARYEALCEQLAGRAYAPTAQDAGLRALSAALLHWLSAAAPERAVEHAARRYREANNLTDRLSALVVLNEHPGTERDRAMADFARRGEAEPLLLDRWYALWARARDTTAQRIESLEQRPDFDTRNPNRVRALLQVFAEQNWEGFHRTDGSGYALLAERVLAYDRRNPTLAARLVEAFEHVHRHVGPAHALERLQIERMAACPERSAQLNEWLGHLLKPQH